MHVLTVDFKAPDAHELFAKSLIETGFAVVKNHPINMSLVNEAYQDWIEFFAHDDKFNYMFDKEKQDGYFPLAIAEIAKGHKVKDIKEFYQIYPWGRYPSDVGTATKKLYADLVSLGATLLQWIEDNTPHEISSKFSMPLSKMIQDSDMSMLRILHYPPLAGTEDPGAIRAAAHEDINLITLLPAATTPGLQVKDVNGHWHEVSCDPGTIVVNTGDMLQMCSKNFYKSTTHRVMNPVGEAAKQPRLSMPLFLHPRPDVKLSDKYTSAQYLLERLTEIGLK